MKYFIYLCLFLILSSCGEFRQQVDEVKTDFINSVNLDSILETTHFDRTAAYEAISLHYKGKPLLNMGQDLRSINNTLSFRYDPNGTYQDYSSIIRDYLSLDDSLSLDLKEGSINGALYFAAEQESQQVFDFSGYWTIDVLITEDNNSEVIELICNHFFPILKGQLRFEEGWEYRIEKGGFTEFFSLTPPEDKGFWWTLNYEIKL